MANSISWGKVYCNTWFGNAVNTLYSIPSASAPDCWAGTLILSADDTAYTADNTIYTADRTQE